MTLQQSSKRTFKFKLLVVFFFGVVLCSPVIFVGWDKNPPALQLRGQIVCQNEPSRFCLLFFLGLKQSGTRFFRL